MKHAARTSILVGSMLAAASLSGCQSPSTVRSDWMESDGIPADRYIVGDGFDVHFTAPVPGVASLVEMTNRNIFRTESLDEGEEFEMSLSGGSSERYETVFGLPPSEVNLVLYFVPLADMGYPNNQVTQDASDSLEDGLKWDEGPSESDDEAVSEIKTSHIVLPNETAEQRVRIRVVEGSGED